MKVYIAGKITGDNGYKAKFAKAWDELSEKGHAVLNPSILPSGMTNADYMRICLSMIDSADAVYFLPDYKGSPGAQIELAYCLYIGKPVDFFRKEEGSNGD